MIFGILEIEVEMLGYVIMGYWAQGLKSIC